MKIKPEQLPSNLKQGLQPLYWINGDEPLLIQERADQIRAFCRDNDFQDRESFSVERNFNWELFSQATSNLSLFAEKKLIELRFVTSKLEEPGKQALQKYFDDPNPDYVILITSPRIEPATLNTKWFKALDQSMVMVQVWPLSVDELPNWLSQRLLSSSINATPDALQLLVEKVEGNLLAAVQEIEKLILISKSEDNQTINLDAETVMQVVGDSSRYNTFALVDAALSGDSKRALRIVRGLNNEGFLPLALVGAVSGELRRLLPLLKKVQSGQSINSVVQSSRINFKRKQAVTIALQRMRPALVYSLLDQTRLIDYAVRGLSTSDPWSELENLFLRMSGVTTATSKRVA